MNFLQITAGVYSINPSFFGGDNIFVRIITNPAYSLISLLDCELSSAYQSQGISNSMPFIFYRIIASQFVIVCLACILIITILVIFLLLKHKKNILLTVACSILIFISQNQAGILSLLLGTASCKNIDDVDYVLNYT